MKTTDILCLNNSIEFGKSKKTKYTSKFANAISGGKDDQFSFKMDRV